jgi:carboxypeptidase Q
MRLRRIAGLLGFAAMAHSPLAAQAPAPGFSPAIRRNVARLIEAAMHDTLGYSRLGFLTDTYGNRLSGSASLEHAIDWALTTMQQDGFDQVHGEPVMVPHWVRGSESVVLNTPRSTRLHLLGLGGSIGTPAAGVTAPVLVVNSFDDLTAHATDARGKIVLFDVPFPTGVLPMEGYRIAVAYRVTGAIAAAKVGAVGALIRSVASFSIQSPHTGSTHYDSTVTPIPIAALSVEDAEMLHRMQNRGQAVSVTLTMQAHTEPDAMSRNTIAEITGSERPDEVVVISGHFDSWDVGQGAMDDGGGALAAWEAVRLMQQLGIHPRRTIRVVLWTNEENGTRGGRAYHDDHRTELANHVAAIESDNGVFRPFGFTFQGSAAGLAKARQLSALLAPIGATRMIRGDAEADVEAMITDGVPGFGLLVDDTRYFWYHHSDADMMTMIDPVDFRKCLATMVVLAYVLGDMPGTLPR